MRSSASSPSAPPWASGCRCRWRSPASCCCGVPVPASAPDPRPPPTALARLLARWVERLQAVPDAPLLLVANEFFDALPIRQFLMTPEGWRERLVDADAEDRLFPALGASVVPLGDQASLGQVREVGAAAAAL